LEILPEFPLQRMAPFTPIQTPRRQIEIPRLRRHIRDKRVQPILPGMLGVAIVPT
jgi:hypothetical protein